MITRIAKWIEFMSPSFIVGVNLFAGWRPATAARRSSLVSEATPGGVDGYQPDRTDKFIQIISRGETYYQAREDAETLFRAIHGQTGWNIPVLESADPPLLAMTIDALGAPFYIGQDEKGNFEFSCNYVFRTEEESCEALSGP